jgi:hypothetical protein
VDLVVLQAFAGAGALLPGRAGRAAVWTGIGLSLGFWLAGQGLGEFWSGLATDPATAPVMILLGAAGLGAAPGARRGRHVRPPSRMVPPPARVLVEAGLHPAGGRRPVNPEPAPEPGSRSRRRPQAGS